MSSNSHYRQPGWFTKNVFNGLIASLTKVGVSVWGSRILSVRGRTSGEWRSNPVNLLTLNEHSYLVAPRGQTQWVRNLRVAKSGELRVGKRIQPFGAVELQDDQKSDILRAYLKRWKMEVGVFFDGVSATSPDAEVARIAPDHPIFEVTFEGASS
jgi:deazaflavin-dependent oxidoreductase (nitroreductase family)